MSDLGAALLSAKDVLSIPLTMGDLTFSFWDIILWLIVASVVVWLVLKWSE